MAKNFFYWEAPLFVIIDCYPPPATTMPNYPMEWKSGNGVLNREGEPAMQQFDSTETACINHAGETGLYAGRHSRQHGLRYLVRCKLALLTACTALILSGCGGGSGGTPAAATLPTLSIADASVVEGSGGGTTNLDFTVTLSAASVSAVTVDYTTSDGTALSASDYTPSVGTTLTIAAGATTGTITVLIGADTTTEANETLTLTLSNPANATITTAAATGTITNDDWIYNSAAGLAMINAGFVYVPGGWDVNGDGSIESGFWLSKYQASATATPAAINANLIDYLAGTAANGYADGMHVYNPATKQFDQTLCIDGTDAGGATPAGCRGNNYIKAGNAGIAVPRVQFVNNAVPLGNESAVEAMAAIADSQVAGGVAISLPSELQCSSGDTLLNY